MRIPNIPLTYILDMLIPFGIWLKYVWIWYAISCTCSISFNIPWIYLWCFFNIPAIYHFIDRENMFFVNFINIPLTASHQTSFSWMSRCKAQDPPSRLPSFKAWESKSCSRFFLLGIWKIPETLQALQRSFGYKIPDSSFLQSTVLTHRSWKNTKQLYKMATL